MKVAYNYSKDFDTQKCTDEAVKGITKICTEIGPREPGSTAEFETQKIMGAELERSCEKISFEDFIVHGQAFTGFIPFMIILEYLTIIAYLFVSPLLALIFSILAILPFIFEFLLYKKFIDKLFPKHTSHNLEAVRKPSGEVKKRFIIVAHADSSYEWKLNYWFGGKFLVTTIVIVIISLFVNLIVSAIGLGINVLKPIFFGNNIFLKWLTLAMLVFVPFQFLGFFFRSPKKCVNGANDNLSGCYVAIGVANALEDANVRLNETELVVLCTGSEESGLRGAKAYAKKHLGEKDSVDTCVISVDTFKDLDYLAVFNRDLTGTLHHDVGASEMLKQAGTNCGFDLPYESIYIGASDSAAFTQLGYKAVGLAAMDTNVPRYYHTRLDDYDTLEPNTIKTGIEIMLEAVCMYDSQGLPNVEKKENNIDNNK